ncbi:MAG: MATE family efflux transporter [Phycisphaerales bacterium]
MSTAPSQPEQAPTGAASPLRELIAIALPAVATMTSYTLMQFVDLRMVADLGADAIAAQGNGGMTVWIPMAALIGTLSIVNTFVAQNLGAGTPEKGSAYAWNGLWMCALAAIGMLALAAVCRPVFEAMGHTAEVVRLETVYTQILLFGAFFPLAARALSHFFYGAHRPGVVLIATVAANVVNVVANYALIFGKWGFPELGITGAAIGTVLGGLVEFAIPMALFLSPSIDAKFRSRSTWRVSLEHWRRLWRVGWPSGLQQGNEIICWGVFMMVLTGSFGTVDNAASWVTLRYLTLAFMPTLGLSFAVTAVVGRYLGAGDVAGAERCAWLGVRLGMAYMGACALLFVILREPMIRFFVSDEFTLEQADEMVRIGGWLMVCAAVFQLFDAVGVVLMGALRGAGDTIWPGVVSASLSWTITVGGGWAMATALPDLRSIGPWMAAALYIILLGVAMVWRFVGGRWRSINLLGAQAPAGPDALDTPVPSPAMAGLDASPERAGV